MEQPSIACFFNNRKRAAVDDLQFKHQAKKALFLDSPSIKVQEKLKSIEEKPISILVSQDESKNEHNKEDQLLLSKRKIVIVSPQVSSITKVNSTRRLNANRSKKIIKPKDNMDIKELINNINNRETTESTIKNNRDTTPPPPSSPRTPPRHATNLIQMNRPSLKEIKNKMRRHVRLLDLKASICKFDAADKKLEKIEEKTSSITDSPKLKDFQTIELEIQTTPKKEFPPDQAYLSPKKLCSAGPGVRRNLLNSLSPTKSTVSTWRTTSTELFPETDRKNLLLPYKYRFLAEVFRAIDTTVQILHNRKDVIVFKKVKSAVEEMLKRNLTEDHLAQIKTIYPDAFEFTRRKIKDLHSETWQLIIKPLIGDSEVITPEILLQRRRKLFNILLNKTKDYHYEFLMTLDRPLNVAKDKITAWHSEFDLEKVPNIPISPLPKPPCEEKITSGKEMFEKAKELFSCNTRMERALEKFKEKESTSGNIVEKNDGQKNLSDSVLKGIPKALIEKVRQKQAAKALLTMTRSTEEEKEIWMYSRLPELARLSRNVFVSEKKGVLQLDILLDKLLNCYRGNLTRMEMENHLKVISKEFPDWLEFIQTRKCMHVKLKKNADLSLIVNKLEAIYNKRKNES